MGDTHIDPTDHSRTHQPHAGESMIDVYFWPGLFLIAVGVVALVGFLAALAYHHTELLVWAGATAVLTFCGGVSWLAVERRRVRRIEARWLAEHPGEQRRRHA
ncbi:MAG TPA: protein UsfY [Mycobacterium sp.]|nr:protein UsfY [Mycobacterium sp.]